MFSLTVWQCKAGLEATHTHLVSIHSGIVLCNLLNYFVPGIIKYTDVSFRPQRSRVRLKRVPCSFEWTVKPYDSPSFSVYKTFVFSWIRVDANWTFANAISSIRTCYSINTISIRWLRVILSNDGRSFVLSHRLWKHYRNYPDRTLPRRRSSHHFQRIALWIMSI